MSRSLFATLPLLAAIALGAGCGSSSTSSTTSSATASTLAEGASASRPNDATLAKVKALCQQTKTAIVSNARRLPGANQSASRISHSASYIGAESAQLAKLANPPTGSLQQLTITTHALSTDLTRYVGYIKTNKLALVNTQVTHEITQDQQRVAAAGTQLGLADCAQIE